MVENVLPVVMRFLLASPPNGEPQPVVHPVDDLVVDQRLELTREEQLLALRRLQPGGSYLFNTGTQCSGSNRIRNYLVSRIWILPFFTLKLEISLKTLSKVSQFIIITHTMLEKFKKLKISTY